MLNVMIRDMCMIVMINDEAVSLCLLGIVTNRPMYGQLLFSVAYAYYEISVVH